MKNCVIIILMISFAITGLFCSCGSSGSSDLKKKIEGKWQWTTFESQVWEKEKLDRQAQVDTISDSLSKADAQKTLDFYISATVKDKSLTIMEFGSGGSYKETRDGAISYEGNWSLSEDGKKIVTTLNVGFSEPSEDTWTILELTEGKMVITSSDSWGNAPFKVSCNAI